MIHLINSITSTITCPKGSPVQKRLSIHNWNPGTRRGREGAIEKQVEGKWHVITLQETIEFVHVTLNGRCAVLFKKDTFFSYHQRQIHLPSRYQARPAGQGV